MNPNVSGLGPRSHSMFFVRNTPNPRHLKYLKGADGLMTFITKDNPVLGRPSPQTACKGYIYDRPSWSLDFESNPKHRELVNGYRRAYSHRHRSKLGLFPPIQPWTSSCMITEDTKRWQLELNKLARSIGILTADERRQQAGLVDDEHLLLCNDQLDREIWLLDRLAQILKTKSMVEVQSWLVSANLREKEAVKELIQKAVHKNANPRARTVKTAVVGEKKTHHEIVIRNLKITPVQTNDKQDEPLLSRQPTANFFVNPIKIKLELKSKNSTDQI